MEDQGEMSENTPQTKTLKGPIALQPIPISTHCSVIAPDSSFTFTVTLNSLIGEKKVKIGCSDQVNYLAPDAAAGSTNNGWPYEFTFSNNLTQTSHAVRLKPNGIASSGVVIFSYQLGSIYTPGNEASSDTPLNSSAGVGILEDSEESRARNVNPIPANPILSTTTLLGKKEDVDLTLSINSLLRESQEDEGENAVMVDCVVFGTPHINAHKHLESPSGEWPYKLKFHRRRTATLTIKSIRGVTLDVNVRILAYQIPEPGAPPTPTASRIITIYK